jgi:signal peptidase I
VAGTKLKNPRFANGLASFDAAVDCAAANNRLKPARQPQPERIRACAGIRFHYQNQVDFPDAKRTAIRAGKCSATAPEGATGIGKAMSVTSGTKSESGLGETIRVVIHAILIALVIRTFLFQPFNIPSGSMKATLLVGDYLFVSKYSYGYSHYSIPLSPPLFSGRVFGSEPARGDIVVFRLPKDDTTDYIKRVIGLPGDRIQMRDGLLYINDKPVKRERLSDFIGEDPCGSDATARVKRWKETLPNGVSYESLDCQDNGYYDNTIEYQVPPGHFFMMGDNRDNSTDSRVQSAVGYVPFENIVGRAQMIFFSIAEGEHAWMFWRWPTAVRWNRLFSIVR